MTELPMTVSVVVEPNVPCTQIMPDGHRKLGQRDEQARRGSRARQIVRCEPQSIVG